MYAAQNHLGRLPITLCMSTFRIDKMKALRQRHQDLERAKIQNGLMLPLASVKRLTRPGPVSVTRKSAGKLQLERCKDGSDHTDTRKKSRRSDLAKYIVGTFY